MNVKHTQFEYTPKIPSEILQKEADSYQYQSDQEQSHFQDHIDRSFQTFEEALPQNGTTALFIGPGHARDIPLSALSNFQNITLLDIDPQCQKVFTSEQDLQADVTFWQEDFTVRGGEIIKAILECKNHTRLERILSVIQIIERACKHSLHDPFPAQRFEFIGATVVLSQVNCLINDAIGAIFSQRDRVEILQSGDSLEHKGLKKMTAIMKQYALIQQKFLLDFMYSRLTPNGVLYLSMTPILTERKVDPKTLKPLKAIKYPLIDLPQIDQEIDKRFTLLGNKNVWEWKATRATEEMNWIERIFTVQTRALKQKD